MALNQEEFTIVLNARDLLGPVVEKSAGRADAALNRYGKSVDQVGVATKRTHGLTDRWLAGANRAVTGLGPKMLALSAGILTVHKAQQLLARSTAFSDAMGEVASILPDAAGDANQYANAVKLIAAEHRKAAPEVAQGLYQVISAGATDAAAALEILNRSQVLSTASLATTEEAVDLVTTTINAYGLAVGDAADVSDIWFTTVREGKTTISELSGVIGQVLPKARALGVDAEVIAAAFATLTKQGIATPQAGTAIRALLDALTRQGLGSQVGSQGLPAVLRELDRVAPTLNDKMAALGGNTEALTGLLALTGNSAGLFAQELAALESRAGATDRALEKIQSQSAYKVQKALNGMEVASISLGDAMHDAFAQAIDDMGGVESVQARIQQGMENLVPVVEKVAGFMGWIFDAATAQADVPRSGKVPSSRRDLLAEVLNSGTIPDELAVRDHPFQQLRDRRQGLLDQTTRLFGADYAMGDPMLAAIDREIQAMARDEFRKLPHGRLGADGKPVSDALNPYVASFFNTQPTGSITLPPFFGPPAPLATGPGLLALESPEVQVEAESQVTSELRDQLAFREMLLGFQSDTVSDTEELIRLEKERADITRQRIQDLASEQGLTEEQVDALTKAIDDAFARRVGKITPQGGPPPGEQINDVTRAMAGLRDQADQAVASGLGDFFFDLATGAADAGDAVRALVTDLLRIGTQAFAIQLLGSLVGGGGFGVFSAAAGAGVPVAGNAHGGIMPHGKGNTAPPVNFYSNGGIASTPQVAVYGEGRGREAYVPLKDNRYIPVVVEGGGGMSLTINAPTTVQAIDSRSFDQAIEARSKAVGKAMEREVQRNATLRALMRNN